MIRSARSLLILTALLLAVAACAPAAGPLGTPATPPPSVEPSGEPPTDELPSSVPTIAPATAAPSPTGTAPAGPSSGPSSAPTATSAPTRTATPAPTATTVVRAYFVHGSFTGNDGLVPVLRTSAQTKAVASLAMRVLLEGPNDAEMTVAPAIYTAIPDATRLLGVTVQDQVATVDLSSEFASGGGTYSMSARLAQVVYTLTQFPTIDKVRFELDGKPVTTFSSEGIVLDGPVGRADFRGMLPAIFVDRPAWGASLGNPGRVSGLANVFEATFQVELLDAKGNVLTDGRVMASCGTGCWGRFSTSLAYDVARAQYGTLRVYNLSAKDGSRENVSEYQVWLTPGS